MQKEYLTPPAATMNEAKELSTKFHAEMSAFSVISVHLLRKEVKKDITELVEYYFLDRALLEETFRNYIDYQDYVLYPESDYDSRGLNYYKAQYEKGLAQIYAIIDGRDLSEFRNKDLKREVIQVTRDIDRINDDFQRMISYGEFGKFAYSDVGPRPVQI